MTFSEVYDTLRHIVGDMAATEQRALFHDTAERIYRIAEGSGAGQAETG